MLIVEELRLRGIFYRSFTQEVLEHKINMKNNELHILVTNDDGVYAPGVLALAQELRKLGKVTIVAPDITGRHPDMLRLLIVLASQGGPDCDGSIAFAWMAPLQSCVAFTSFGHFYQSQSPL